MRRALTTDPADRATWRAAVLLVVILAGGCGAHRTPPDDVVATSSASATIPASPHVPSASPPELDADLAAAVARWAAFGQASCSYTVDSSVPGLSSTTDHVISIEGHAERVAVQTSSFSGWGDEQVTVPGMFDLIRSNRDRSGTIEATYDPVLGYPLTIRRDDPTISDGSWSMQVRDFRSSLDVPPTHDDLDARLADAREAWDRWAPSDYAYDWQLVPVDGIPTGAGWSIRHVDGVTTAAPSFGDTATFGLGAASIPASFDAIEAAAARGAWIDAVFDPVLGLPILVGIDPTPAPGDDSWLRIAFHDIVAETGRADLAAAHERWSTNRPVRYSYVWREDGGGRHWTYRVAMNGDVAKIRTSGGAPRGEAAALAPRIDDLFMLLEKVLANGGHVDATYDAQLGYPTRVMIDAPGSLVEGTITIRSVVIDAAG